MESRRNPCFPLLCSSKKYTANNFCQYVDRTVVTILMKKQSEKHESTSGLRLGRGSYRVCDVYVWCGVRVCGMWHGSVCAVGCM